MSQVMRLIGRAVEACTLAILFIALAFFAAGCSGGSSTFTPPPAPPHSIEGGVHSGIAGIDGGEIPIIGATVTVYAAGTSGYGSAPTQLGQTFTDNDGNFKLRKFACPSTSSQIYLVATGGSINGSVNIATAFMTAVGTCGNLKFTDGAFSTDLDELTTIASTYALSQFMNPSNPTQVGSGAYTVGITNAMAVVPNFVNFDDGTPGHVITFVPNSPMTLDTLSNIIAACVQSGSAASTQCTTLTAGVKPPPGAPAATDTLMAALDMARNPTFNVAALFNLQPASPPYIPVLKQAPSAWLLPIVYIGGGLSEPVAIAVDVDGNIWTANANRDSISKFSPSGVPISPTTGYTGGGLHIPSAIAISTDNNIWVTSESGSTVEFNNSGAVIGGSGANFSNSIAIDFLGNIWVTTQSGNRLSKLSSGGALAGEFTGPGMTSPLSVAIDGGDNAWVSTAMGMLNGFNSAGAPLAGSPFTGGGLMVGFGVAIDASGNVWVNNSGTGGIGGISKFTSTGFPLAPNPAGFTGGGENGSGVGIAIDSAGNVWSTNQTSTGGSGSVSETSNAGVAISPPAGFTDGALNEPFGVTIDGSGNVWIANANGQASSITEYIGAASPVFPPLAQCLSLQAKAVCKP